MKRLFMAKGRGSWLALVALTVVISCNSKTCNTSGCDNTGCSGVESCDQCVKRCVEEQGVSAEICRGAACGKVCANK